MSVTCPSSCDRHHVFVIKCQYPCPSCVCHRVSTTCLCCVTETGGVEARKDAGREDEQVGLPYPSVAPESSHPGGGEWPHHRPAYGRRRDRTSCLRHSLYFTTLYKHRRDRTSYLGHRHYITTLYKHRRDRTSYLRHRRYITTSNKHRRDRTSCLKHSLYITILYKHRRDRTSCLRHSLCITILYKHRRDRTSFLRHRHYITTLYKHLETVPLVWDTDTKSLHYTNTLLISVSITTLYKHITYISFYYYFIQTHYLYQFLLLLYTNTLLISVSITTSYKRITYISFYYAIQNI